MADTRDLSAHQETFVFSGGYGCHSACALAFLGGRDAATAKPLRVMMSGAKLGFHQFSAKFDSSKTYSKKDMAAAVEDTHRVMDAIIGYLHDFADFDEELGIGDAGLAPDATAGKSVIPCLEPCAILMEAARSAVRAEQQQAKADAPKLADSSGTH